MANRIKEVEILNKSPFQNNKLNRFTECNVLTSIVETCDGEGVIALNGTWGCGKTTFLKIWRHHLSGKGYTSLYFNAWENDYLSDPLIGLLGEIKEEGWLVNTSQDGEKLVDSTLKVIGSVVKSAIKNKAKDVTGVDFDEVVDTIHKEFFTEELDNYKREKSPVAVFREALTNIVYENTKDGKPLVFIIDELDRCAPSYAVKMLERVKHLFSIPNVVFVLSIDKEQLANSVRGYYGSERINAEEYLRRFIDVEYSLPRLDTTAYVEYITKELEVNKLFNDRSASGEFEFFVPRLIDNKTINLRQIQKILASVKLALKSTQANFSYHAHDFFLLAYIRMSKPIFYAQVKAHSLSLDELVIELEDLFKEEIQIDNSGLENIPLFDQFASFICLYNNHRSGRNETPKLLKEIVTYDTNGNEVHQSDLTFKTSTIDRKRLANKINDVQCRNSALDIDYFISKLELKQNLIR